jgi:hypothetical protein
MYSLGCVMYESLMGRAPVTADSIIELVHKHTSETPAPFKAMRRDVVFPQQLEAVVFKTLEKEPDKRFPSMAALKHNLEFIPKFAQDESVVRAAREAAGSDADSVAPKRRPLRRRTKWAIGIVACALVVGAGSVATLIYAVNPQGDNSIQDALMKVRLGVVQTLEPSNSLRLLDLTEKLRDSYDKQGLTAEALKMADQAVLSVGAAHLEGWRLAHALMRRAQLREQLKERNAHEGFEEALGALRSKARDNRQNKNWQGNLTLAEPIDKTILELERKLGKGPSTMAAALLSVADDKRFSGQIEDADEQYNELLGMTAVLKPEQKESLATGLLQLADAAAVRGREQAETYYKAALDLRTPKDPSQKPTEDCAKAARALGLYYKNHDQITKAEATLMDALAMAQAAGGEHSALVVSLYDDLGEVYRAEKEFDKATEMFKLAERLKQSQ